MNLFELENISCGYNAGGVVLKVDHLEIPRKCLTFLLGVSGVGKSTILETLGVMNNTIVDVQSDSKFVFANDSVEVDIMQLWQRKDLEIAAYRKKHYSFVFQSTNLMNNMSVLENAMMSQLIQDEHPEVAEVRARNLLHRVGIPVNRFDGPPQHISGGQRQRLAFARAMGTKADVLFADEPTGNLDPWNASIVMDILQKNLEEEGLTGVIVTHDIDLALKYADQIVYIRKDHNDASGKTTGLIDALSHYQKSVDGKWMHRLSADGGRLLSDDQLSSHLLELFVADIEKTEDGE